MWHPTDPATGLPSAAPRLDGIFDSRACVPYWELEFLADDVNQFHDLARSPVPVGTLRASTGDRQMRSPRFRQFLAPHVGDELRAVLRVRRQAVGGGDGVAERGSFALLRARRGHRG
jgi:hypothetical protein